MGDWGGYEAISNVSLASALVQEKVKGISVSAPVCFCDDRNNRAGGNPPTPRSRNNLNPEQAGLELGLEQSLLDQ